MIKDVFRDTAGLIQHDNTVKCPKCSYAWEPDFANNSHSWRSIQKAERIRWNSLTPEEQQEELRVEAEAGF